jgi:hypothetical protein
MKPRQFARYNAYYLQSPSEDASRYANLEAIDFSRSFAEMSLRRRSPHQLPVTVLSASYGFGTPQGVWHRFGGLVNGTWKRSQIYLAKLHTRTKRVVVFGSGHQIHVNRPGVVARYVLGMVTRARGA